jgi:hypothetical protein
VIKFVNDLFFPGTPVLFTTESDRHNIAEILLKEKPNDKQYIFEGQDLHIFILFCLFGDIPDSYSTKYIHVGKLHA